MRQIQLLSKAEVDLFNIQSYTQETWGRDKAEEILSEINLAFENIALLPFSGRTTREVNVFVKTLAKLPFVIVYRVDDISIYIIQIIHTKRNR